MTDNTEGWGEPEQTEGAPVPAPAISYPEPSRTVLSNHRFTISVANNGPHIAVRAETAEEVTAAFQELIDANLGAALGTFWAQVKAEGQVANGLGGATPVPPAPQNPIAQQAAQQFPTPPQPGPQQAPNQPYPGQPAWQQAGAPQGQPQQQWGGQAPQAVSVPQGWYKLDVPFKPKGNNPGKPGFDQIVSQYSFRKGDPNNGGQVSFQKAVKSWYCAPDIAGAFAAFSPVPA